MLISISLSLRVSLFGSMFNGWLSLIPQCACEPFAINTCVCVCAMSMVRNSISTSVKANKKNMYVEDGTFPSNLASLRLLLSAAAVATAHFRRQTNVHINTVLVSPSSIRSINIIKPERSNGASRWLWLVYFAYTQQIPFRWPAPEQNENECVKMAKMKTSAEETSTHTHRCCFFFGHKKRPHQHHLIIQILWK